MVFSIYTKDLLMTLPWKSPYSTRQSAPLTESPARNNRKTLSEPSKTTKPVLNTEKASLSSTFKLKTSKNSIARSVDEPLLLRHGSATYRNGCKGLV